MKFALPKDYPCYSWFHFISVNGYKDIKGVTTFRQKNDPESLNVL